MKRSIVGGCALVLFAAPALALETEVTLDGHVGFSASHFDNDVDDNTNLHNNASRLGLEATASEGGYTGFLRYERGMDMYNADSDFDGAAFETESTNQDFVREFYAGIDSPYGRVTVGRFRAAYARAGKRVDPFYDTSLAGFSGTASTYGGQGANYGFSNLTNGFSDRVIELQSANYSGLSFNGNVYLDRGQENDHDYGAGVSYAGNAMRDQAFEVSLQYLEIENESAVGVPFRDPSDGSVPSVGGSPGPSSSFRVSGVYDLGSFSLGANYEYVDVDTEEDARHYSSVTASIPLNAKLRIAAAISYLNFPEDGPAIEGFGGTVGAFYEVLDGLNTYGGVRYVDFDENPSSDGTLALALGAAYSFDLNLR
ncbi:MAG: porin [Algiphilus sp.]|uniref:porin n=1 Tax=Algiphilus sp. TaxID=1872431 RepID=UPI0032EFCC21